MGKIYFSENVDISIIKYLNCNNKLERERIFRNEIYPSLEKLCENLIHTFKIYSTENENFQNLKNELMSFLVLSMEKFDPKRSKAFSFFSVIGKNYLITIQKKYQFKQKKKVYIHYDNFDIVENVVWENPYEFLDYSKNSIIDSIYEKGLTMDLVKKVLAKSRHFLAREIWQILSDKNKSEIDKIEKIDSMSLLSDVEKDNFKKIISAHSIICLEKQMQDFSF